MTITYANNDVLNNSVLSHRTNNARIIDLKDRNLSERTDTRVIS